MTTYALRYDARPWTLNAPPPAVLRNLFAKFTVGDGCWEWHAARNASGYGEFMSRRWPGQSRLAHRLLYELLVAPIPAGLDIDHLCRVRHCVRPDHLEPVTRRINLLRGETVTARNAAVTACPQGHDYDEANTYIAANGGRHCRKCKAASERRRQRRLRELVAA